MPYHVVDYRESSRRPFGARPSRAVTGYYSGKVHSRIIPRVAHQRIVSVPPPSRYFQSQDPFADGSRYSLIPIPYTVKIRSVTPSYTSKVVRIEDLDSSSGMDEFEAETRCIRRDANSLLMHMGHGMPIPLYAVHNIPLRNAGEAKQVVDIRRRWVRERNNLGPMSKIHSEIYTMAMYQEPMRRHGGGRGVNLACISYAGGRPISKRQLRFYPEDDRVRNDVSFRAFYNDLRIAATLGVMYKKPLYQPLYRSKKSKMGAIEPEKKEEKKYGSKWEQRAITNVDSHEIPIEKPARRPVEEIRENVVLPSPRKSIVELERQPTVEEYVEAQPVVVKMPRKSAVEPEPVPEEPVAAEEPVEQESIPEPEPEPEPTPVEEEEVFETPAEEVKPLEPEPEPVAEEKVVEEILPEPEAEPEAEPIKEEPVEEIEAPQTTEEVEPEPVQADEAVDGVSEPEAELVAEPEPIVEKEYEPQQDTPVEEAEAPLVNGTVEDEVIEEKEAEPVAEAEESVPEEVTPLKADVDVDEEAPIENNIEEANNNEAGEAADLEDDKAQEEEDLEPEPEPEPDVEDLPEETEEEAGITSPPPPEPSPVPIKSEEEDEEEEEESE